ncbi:nitrous oxide-stimulated promoter family protein [Pseudoflavonifractor hominis]|uniref:nitrous oxide-stimulated promoter family protein n=1 Tax=Pseudoflavonifractor hominis TaxID=2763059 RepID=UPI001FAC4933|nr:nitrous oxide-stimulated promoter family protein [Pseudoflavonifractor hominis]
MIRLFCKKLHRQIDLCPDCQEVLSYAMDRSDLCPLIERKTFCSSCKIAAIDRR